MGKFVKKVILFFVFCIVIAIVPAYILDPYNVFHWNNMRNNGVEPNKNYIKTKYVINNPDKFDGFLFGSSRVGSIHVEKITDLKIYNMTYSQGTPKEQLETLRTFLENDVNVDVVYLGVDSYSYTVDSENHKTQPIRCPYQELDTQNLISMYIDPTIVGQRLIDLLLNSNNNKTDGSDVFYNYGWWCDYGATAYIDWELAKPSMGSDYLLEETLNDISEMKELCNANDIQLVVFTNPMYDITYQESILNKNYFEFLKGLASITDYYNFSGKNDITVSRDNYIDTSHYNAYIGDMLIEVMIDGETQDTLYSQGFGWHITENNIDELIELLESQQQ